MLNKIRKLQNKKGFTLVELIVVIAIIAILTAVIVPLVSRYTTQATYTSLQAGADSIQSQANAAIAAYSMTGKVFSGKLITGLANSDGTPKDIYVDGTKIKGKDTAFDGDYAVMPLAGASTELTDDAYIKMRNSIIEGLKEKLAGDAFFVVAVENGGVTGVIYSPEGEAAIGNGTATLSAITGYDDAYQVTTNDNANHACGMLGIYKTAANNGGEDGTAMKEYVPEKKEEA